MSTSIIKNESAGIPTSTEVDELSMTPLCVGKREAAKLLGISERTLTTWTAAGEIPSILIHGRRLYPIEPLQEWIRKKTVEQSKIENEITIE